MTDTRRMMAAVCALGRQAKMALAACLALLASALAISDARADDAEASGAQHSIAVFYSSLPTDGCHFTGAAKAIEYFVKSRVAGINRAAGYKGNRISVSMFDDLGRPDVAVANVRKALADPTTVAMVGLSGTNRGKAVFEELGKDIGASGIPFISDVSVTSLYAAYPNVFTMRPSQEDERIPVLAKFLNQYKFAKPAFIGASDSLGIDAMIETIGKMSGVPPVIATHRIEAKDGTLPVGAVAPAIENVKALGADVLLVAFGGEAGKQFLKEATATGISVPIIFVMGSDVVLRSPEAGQYPNDLYQFAWDNLPDVYNNRLREQMLSNASAPWIFPDTPNMSAEGWKTGVCKARPETESQTALAPVNLRAISRGTQYADMVGLAGELANAKYSNQSLQVLRSAMVAALLNEYAAGVGSYRGDFDNWSFRSSSRSASRTPAIIMRGRGTEFVQLAPAQYARLRNDQLREIQTVYMDVDVTRVFRVDDEEKSFFAEFYLSMRSDQPFSMDNLDFGNAFMDAEDSTAKVVVTSLHDGGPSGVFPEGIKLAKVVGKFMMSPDLSNYPFDVQLFTVQLKPKNGDTAFIIQPPLEGLRDRAIIADGWSTLDHFVGYDEDFIPISDARTEQRSIVPFYKMHFSWVMKREATDYYLRVVVPLIFILAVAYLSIFIPREHFEAIVTIQVTALLSAVALYLSIPKVSSDYATISDRIFLFDYMAVSLMIAISILRVNPWLRAKAGLGRVLTAAHVVGVPILVIGMMLYVAQLDTGQVPAISVAASDGSSSATKSQP